MKNGYKTTSDLPKVEVEDTIKLTESEHGAVAKCAFVIGMLFGGMFTVSVLILVDIIKAILS